MTDWTNDDYFEVEALVGHTFSDRALLKTCFTHATHANAAGETSNERLEFLGDAVLQLIVTEELFLKENRPEGELTELRKQYVSKSALTRAEENAGLKKYLLYTGGENNVSGKTASNLFEAVVGGLYLDGGLRAAKAFLKKYLVPSGTDNYKTLLQEYVQERTRSTPVYEVREEEGGFFCCVRALGEEATGRGESKKGAETKAARALLTKLTERKE